MWIDILPLIRKGLSEMITNDKKTPVSTERDLSAEIMTLFQKLSPQDKIKALEYLQAFLRMKEGPSSAE